jgi:uncharacterized protein (TIGR03905 family)
MEKITIIPEGICADRILVEVDDGVIQNVVFEGGCDGNGKALGRLLKGMPVSRATELLAGVDCDGKGTSCADQFSKGLCSQCGALKK